MTTVRAGSATDAGKVRDANEDSVLTTDTLFVVADGMGGHAAGEVASRIAVSTLATSLDGQDAEPTEDTVRRALHAANAAILADARRNPERGGMGTTIAGLVLGAGRWFVFNIGDSRVYRLWDNELTQLTVDHNEAEELVAAGLLTAEQARSHPLSNVVTRVVGPGLAPRADIWVLDPAPGERFLVCSDGLSLELTDDEIAAVLRAGDDPEHTAAELVRAAIDAGARDNVSVVVVDH